MEQVEKTRRSCLARARKRELEAMAQVDELMQDRLLDETIWLKIVASLPSYHHALAD